MITNEQKQRYNILLKDQKKIIKKVSKKFIKTYLINVLFGAIIGALLAVYGIKLEKNGTFKEFDFPKIIIGILVLFFFFIIIHIIIHEAGHMVFGLLTGYRFLSFRIFSLTFVKKNGRIKRKKYSIKGTAGQCLMYPPKKKADGSFPYALYNLGGGFANLITSIPFVLAAIFTDNLYIRVAFIVFSVAGLLMAATNLIPMDLGLNNDGMNLLSISKGEYYRDSFYLQLMINAEMSDGKLITDYEYELFDLPDGANDTNMLTAFNRFYSYYWLLANHDYDAAYELLSEMDNKICQYSLASFNLIQAEKLFFMVLHKRQIDDIAFLYHRVRLTFIGSKSNIGILRIQYLYEALLSEDEKRDIMSLVKKKEQKKWKECNLGKLRQEIDRTASNYPVVGEAALYMDILDYCLSEYKVDEALIENIVMP